MSTSTVYSQDGGTVILTKETYTSTTSDESAVSVTGGGTLMLSKSTIEKSGDTTDTTSSSSTGLNAGVIATDASTIVLTGSTITTTGTGSNAAYTIGSGSTIKLSDVTITCSADFAHGVDAVDSSSIVVKNASITTQGAHAAAIATDGESASVIVTGGTATTSGSKSPGIYSVGTITVSDITITANNSEGAAIATGAVPHSITLNNAKVTGSTYGCMLVNTAQKGMGSTSTFIMTGGSLTALDGPVFYATNTVGTYNISDVNVTATTGTLIEAAAGNWGTSGANGADITFTADKQALTGDVVADSISTVTLNLSNYSSLKGTINSDDTASAITLALDATSTWNVTADSYLSSLIDDDTTLANIDDNGYTIYYDSTLNSNSWLNAETYTLKDGGSLTPRS